MSNNSTLSPQAQRAKHKALLVAKIYAERELISLQARRIVNDVKPSTIKQNIIEAVVAKVQGTSISHGLFSYIERHPKVSLLVAQFLMRGVKKSKYSRSSPWWAPLVIGAATWFVTNRRKQKWSSYHQASARSKPRPQPELRYQSKSPLQARAPVQSTANPQAMKRTRVRAQSRPVKFIVDGPSPTMTRRESPKKSLPRRDRRPLRRHMF